MFGFKSRKADVLSHWYTPVPSFSASTQEFYTSLEQELKAQEVPGLEISRVEFSEGGALSDKRQYLRLLRERLVFDICAAPFGTNYFFSCRFAEIPALVKLWQILVLAMGLLIYLVLSLFVCGKIFGRFSAVVWPLGNIALFATAIYLLRNAVAMGLQDLDTKLLHLPVINAVYVRWFRRESYYRQDTRLMYLTVVEGVVKKLVEQETAAKGVKLLTQYEYAPILGELYKPKQKRLDQKEPELTDGPH